MSDRTRLTTVEAVHENRSWLFTATDPHGVGQEVIIVPCEDGVEAWVNRCPHEAQKLDAGRGVAMREGQVICPRHGSTFDACSGYCDNGEAAETTLASVDVTVEDGAVFLVDDDYDFENDGGIGAGDDGPSSSSHLSL